MWKTAGKKRADFKSEQKENRMVAGRLVGGGVIRRGIAKARGTTLLDVIIDYRPRRKQQKVTLTEWERESEMDLLMSGREAEV